ncbi:GNAT family N-acetyltransferase [uncultured Oscillibacter sp.]|uniref:GNAT family N-acetyltransferase n=1 Tax=uncultured Oscillibacter sp. TaxID=876091 RepID=UPI0025D56644|nr:GNAT family N-acetyltransferase [uncultured Oscillibacter sp.]
MAQIRFAGEEDVPALLAIYGRYIATSITFEYELPTAEAFARRVRDISAFYPYLVWEEDGRILGYAYAHRQAERAAYQWNAELSVYLDPSAAGRGLGRRLYGALLALLRLQGVRTAYALVTSPNPRSEALHQALGFRRMGVQRSTGYKDGAWRDVTWFEKAIGAYDDAPRPPRPVGELPPEAVAAVLAKV